MYLGVAKVNKGNKAMIFNRAIKIFKTSILVFKDRSQYTQVRLQLHLSIPIIE